jgi:hypothetical protein
MISAFTLGKRRTDCQTQINWERSIGSNRSNVRVKNGFKVGMRVVEALNI